MSSQMEERVQQCPRAQLSPTHYEPMITPPLPGCPRERLTCNWDRFVRTQKGVYTYLIVVDHFSRYLEIIKLTSLNSQGVLNALKSMSSRHGFPDEIISDNGMKFDSNTFKQFTSSYSINHITSSPYSPAQLLMERQLRTTLPQTESQLSPD